jgi:tetratricopeptide (TPR) repeat protein
VEFYTQSPNAFAAFDSRGLIYFRKGDYARAIADYDAALGLQPKTVTSLYMRGLAKAAMGDAAGSKADAEAARALNANVVGMERVRVEQIQTRWVQVDSSNWLDTASIGTQGHLTYYFMERLPPEKSDAGYLPNFRDFALWENEEKGLAPNEYGWAYDCATATIWTPPNDVAGPPLSEFVHGDEDMSGELSFEAVCRR